jgi:hypothetical protein
VSKSLGGLPGNSRWIRDKDISDSEPAAALPMRPTCTNSNTKGDKGIQNFLRYRRKTWKVYQKSGKIEVEEKINWSMFVNSFGIQHEILKIRWLWVASFHGWHHSTGGIIPNIQRQALPHNVTSVCSTLVKRLTKWSIISVQLYQLVISHGTFGLI